MQYWIQPCAAELGINKRIGWHTFRHTFATLLYRNVEDVKVVQELMRHSSSRITLDIYAQAVTSAKRKAQERVIRDVSVKQKSA
jgi:integrase